jgi:outer membrane protein assembly factor BamE
MLPGLSAHRIDIQQGNYVTQEMVDRIKPGMSRSQVRFGLGTPLVVDPFHPDRWDYVYVLQKSGRVVEKRRIVAVFEEDKLLRLEGAADLPKEAISTVQSAAPKSAAKPPDGAAPASK